MNSNYERILKLALEICTRVGGFAGKEWRFMGEVVGSGGVGARGSGLCWGRVGKMIGNRGKKLIVTKDIIRQALLLDDANGVECLPTEEIFVEIGMDFLGVETPLFDTMLVLPQADAENEDDNEKNFPLPVKKVATARRKVKATASDNNIKRSLINSFQQVVSELDTTSGETGKKSGRTVTLTAKDMQKKKNDVKARTTLLLSLPDEHQL
nr:hypothetical protein [Tanacetum cinerariifolium]